MPRSSAALQNLGDMLLSIHESGCSDEDLTLKDIEKLFRASMTMEGENMISGEIPSQLLETSFWKTKLSSKTLKTEVKRGAGESSKIAPANKNPTVTKGRGKAIPPTLKSNSGNKAAVAGGRATQPPRGKINPVSKPAPASKAAVRAPPGRAGATNKSAAVTKKKSSTDCVGHKASSSKITKGDTSKTNTICEGSASKVQDASSSPTVLNPVSYAARLGLARVLLRLNNNEQNEEVQQLYNKVIEMAPMAHDAYIELGELLAKNDPQKAIDVYLKYPFESNSNPDSSFDDAFLYGEAVRLLMKGECFEDSRLQSSMISLGKIMGFPVLEKYINILDSKLKYTKMLREIYAAVNGKDVNDKDLEPFFKFKLWL